MAPDWYLNTLPACPLDGELWAGRGSFQKTLSIARKLVPLGDGEEWKELDFAVFSTPSFDDFIKFGEIKNPQQHTTIDEKTYEHWVSKVTPLPGWLNLTAGDGGLEFSAELATLIEWVDSTSDTVFVVQQTKLPEDAGLAASIVHEKMLDIIEQGGEGLVLRNPDGSWEPKRSGNILKVKNTLDDEAVITGYTSGAKTHIGGKFLGMIGALITEYNGKRLEISGMTDEERAFANKKMAKYAIDFPGQDMPDWVDGKVYKLGEKITFAYRELTNGGLPKEARVLRKRKDE